MGDFAGQSTERNLRQVRVLERRRFKRGRVALAVRELRPERHVLRTSNVSAGGVFCPYAPPRAVGTELLLELELPSGRSLAVTARVVGRRGPQGLAIAFDQPVLELQSLTEKSRSRARPKRR
jgi:hypothetical protein